jgi:hypothetical protein
MPFEFANGGVLLLGRKDEIAFAAAGADDVHAGNGGIPVADCSMDLRTAKGHSHVEKLLSRSLLI